jgi:hypothetical protein
MWHTRRNKQDNIYDQESSVAHFSIAHSTFLNKTSHFLPRLFVPLIPA